MIDQAKADEIYRLGRIAGELERDEEIKRLKSNLDWARDENARLCAEIGRLEAQIVDLETGRQILVEQPNPLGMGTLRRWWDRRSTWLR